MWGQGSEPSGHFEKSPSGFGRRQGRGTGRGKHPFHLKGRDIGMFYAAKSRKKREERDGIIEKPAPLCTIRLSPALKTYLTDVISSMSSIFTLNLQSEDRYAYIEDSPFKRDFIRTISCLTDKKCENTGPTIRDGLLDIELSKLNIEKLSNRKYNQMLLRRQQLPSFKMKDKIIEILEKEQVILISGETGCGKTTQVPQFILDYFIEKKSGSGCRIICTQPRRISAISVAERVADERAEKLGESVGFQIRLEKTLPRQKGSILFCTTGVVLKKMETDPDLCDVSHVVLDEIHERNISSDFLLALLKRLVVKRKNLKVILMSATLNAESFSTYFGGCPRIHIPGFTYPVKEYFLEDALAMTGFRFTHEFIRASRMALDRRDKLNKHEFSQFIEPYVRSLEESGEYPRNVCLELRNPNSEMLNLDLVVALVQYICEKERDQGAILIFLPGIAEISSFVKRTDDTSAFPPHKFSIIPLHSLLPTVDQKRIFEPPPPGVRKIIAATNIAETSITIEDVVFVIDCGWIKINDYDPVTNTELLQARWVAQANASQRKGRAGRVKPGVCFHLYSRRRKDELENYILPEILRSRLERVILTTKILKLGDVVSFFEILIDSPDIESVRRALALLVRMNALDEVETLTPMGYHLAKIPMGPQISKMVLYGLMFSCLDPILSIAASLDFKDAFQVSCGNENESDEKRYELSGGLKSDHFLMNEAIQRFETSTGYERSAFCRKYFLSYPTLKRLCDMKKHIMGYLKDLDLVSSTDSKSSSYNVNSRKINVVKAVLCAGLYPNVATIRKSRNGKRTLMNTIEDDNKVEFHPKSVLAKEKVFDSPLMVYYVKVKSAKNYIYDGTMLAPFPLIFFGDNVLHEIEDERHLHSISVNGKIRFKSTESTAAVVSDLKRLWDRFVDRQMAHPAVWNFVEDQYDESNQILHAVTQLVDLDTEYDMELFEDYD